jgi:tetratricopeptide (TPR) repeat protein
MIARVLVVAALLGAWTPFASWAGENPGAGADAAFEAGDHDAALALYDRVLADSPEDVTALVRSGMLLSWQKRYDEAVARYDRALAVDPSHPRAALERAKVLSWAGRYDQAGEAFRSLLAREQGNREARLGLARSLSWGGRQEEAREEYRKVLEVNPADPEALLGVAQTHAWSGDDAKARPAYEDALEADPASKDARVGLAWVDLREEDLAAAADHLALLRREHASDPDVLELERALDRARAPWIRAGWDRLDDSDENTLTTWTLEGGLGLPGATDLRLGAARYEMSTLGRDGAIDSVWGVLGWLPARRHRLEARLGADFRRPSVGEDDTEAIGGVLYRFPLGGTWSGRVSWDRDSYRYSVPILDAAITIDAFAARVDGTFPGSWRLEAGAGAWDLNDGNDRDAVDASILRVFRAGGHTLEAGYGFRWFDWTLDLDNGYFDPRNFTAHLALGRARGPVGENGYYEAAAEAGVQSFTDGTNRVSGDPALGLFGLVGHPIGGGFDLEGYAAFSTSSPQGGEDYRARRLGLRLRYTFGESR